MASLETASLLKNKVSVATTACEPQPPGWKLSPIAADIATLGTGTLLAGLCNAALVFIIPRLISVEDYGYWRLFALYAAYAGFLHLGFADGALLHWAGRAWGDFHHEIRPAFNYLFWQHVAILLPLCLVAALLLHGPLRFVTIAVAVYALIINETTLLQFGLQDAKVFGPVAISTAAAPALFLGFILLWATKWRSDYREVAGFYTAGWLIVMAFLLAWAQPWSGRRVGISVKRTARNWVLSGWPVVVANTGASLIQYADRFAVSWAATIQNFAQYSLASSAMGVPIVAIQACSNVFFSHLAGVTPDARKRMYGLCSRLILIAWAALLPYYFALDIFVRHLLPRYAASLQYARVLLLGIPFLAAVQILQTNYAYLSGMQKGFSARTLAVLVMGMGITFFAAFHFASLGVVAGAQVMLLGSWWLFNEWTLRELTGSSRLDWLRFLVSYFLIAIVYWLATVSRQMVLVSAVAYYGCAASVLVVVCGRDWQLWSVFGEGATRSDLS